MILAIHLPCESCLLQFFLWRYLSSPVPACDLENVFLYFSPQLVLINTMFYGRCSVAQRLPPSTDKNDTNPNSLNDGITILAHISSSIVTESPRLSESLGILTGQHFCYSCDPIISRTRFLKESNAKLTTRNLI